MSKRTVAIAKLRNELFEKKAKMQEFKILVYVHGYLPPEHLVEKTKLWQEDIDLIESELLGMQFGCNLNNKGFNWKHVFTHVKREHEREVRKTINAGLDPRPLRISREYPQDTLFNLSVTPGELGKVVRDVYNTNSVSGFEFDVADGRA